MKSDVPSRTRTFPKGILKCPRTARTPAPWTAFSLRAMRRKITLETKRELCDLTYHEKKNNVRNKEGIV